MAWSNATIPQSEIDSKLAGKPLICAMNCADNPVVQPLWTDGAGTFSDTDKTDQNFPTSAIYDKASDDWTKPNVASNGWKLCLRLDGRPFDMVCLFGLNLVGIAGVGATVSVRIADDANFSVNVAVLASTVAAQNRTALLNMVVGGNNNQRISNALFMRIDIALISGTTPHIPQIGEVIVGQRRQLSAGPDTPRTPQHFRSVADDVRTPGGSFSRYMHASKMRVLDGLTIDLITQADWTAVLSAFTDSDSNPWVYIENPSTTTVAGPNDREGAPFLINSPLDNQHEYVGPFERPWHLDGLLELPPFYESGF